MNTNENNLIFDLLNNLINLTNTKKELEKEINDIDMKLIFHQKKLENIKEQILNTNE